MTCPSPREAQPSLFSFACRQLDFPGFHGPDSNNLMHALSLLSTVGLDARHIEGCRLWGGDGGPPLLLWGCGRAVVEGARGRHGVKGGNDGGVTDGEKYG